MKPYTTKKTLYFIDGFIPTEVELEEAGKLKAFIRNAQAVTKDSPIESCDEVAGQVPPSYSHLPFVGIEPEEKPIEVKPETKKKWNPKKEIE